MFQQQLYPPTVVISTTPVPSVSDVLVLGDGMGIIANRYKTKLCRQYSEDPVTGEPTCSCPYKKKCMFAHARDELRTPEMNLRDGLISKDDIRAFTKGKVVPSKNPVEKKATEKTDTLSAADSPLGSGAHSDIPTAILDPSSLVECHSPQDYAGQRLFRPSATKQQIQSPLLAAGEHPAAAATIVCLSDQDCWSYNQYPHQRRKNIKNNTAAPTFLEPSSSIPQPPSYEEVGAELEVDMLTTTAEGDLHLTVPSLSEEGSEESGYVMIECLDHERPLTDVEVDRGFYAHSPYGPPAGWEFNRQCGCRQCRETGRRLAEEKQCWTISP